MLLKTAKSSLEMNTAEESLLDWQVDFFYFITEFYFIISLLLVCLSNLIQLALRSFVSSMEDHINASR